MGNVFELAQAVDSFLAGVLPTAACAVNNTQIKEPDPRSLTCTRNAPRLLSARRVNLIVIGDQVSVLPFSALPLHSALNFANCSLVRIVFASCMYLLSLASEQPAL